MAAIHLAAISAGSSSRSFLSSASASSPARSRRCYDSNRSLLSRSSFICSQPECFLRSMPAKSRRGSSLCAPISCSAGKLSEAELLPVSEEGFEEKLPSGTGVYGVYDGNGDLQFIGISRNLVASINFHRKSVPDLCHSVKVGLVDGAADRTVLTNVWKSWMQEHLDATGKPPAGNLSGNTIWTRQQRTKADLRLTPGRHKSLTVPLEELIDRLVKENKVVAFIKGSRSAPQCGFSQRVVGILESHGVEYESVNVLDEEYNFGLRETLKAYSNWPTFPQIFVKGELIGGCDILTSMDASGELTQLFKN